MAPGKPFRDARVGTHYALWRVMDIRTFVARDGSAWSVWRIESSEDGVPGTPREWLAFQDAAGTQRRRLFDIPPNWSELPDDRLHLLCRMADPVKLGWEWSAIR